MCSGRRLGRHARALAALLASAATSATATADEVDPKTRAQAELLFREGSDRLDQGAAAEACPKLQAAVDLTKGEALGGKLVLARCYEKLGRTATAWGLY